MKKTISNYPSIAVAASVSAEGKLQHVRTEKFVKEAALPTPPSDEVVARLNAIGREYPFCAYIRQNNLFML